MKYPNDPFTKETYKATTTPTIPPVRRPSLRGKGKWQVWLKQAPIADMNDKFSVITTAQLIVSENINSIRQAAWKMGIKIVTRRQEDGNYLIWRLS